MSKYTDRITSEHADKPKFVAAVEVATDPFVEGQGVVTTLPFDFDLDAAVGAQLDVVGQWVGVTRYVLTPLANVYFSLDTPGLGFDEGYWLGPFDPTQGLTTLSDDFYRILIRATIALNNWDGTIGPAVAAIAPLFPNNLVYIQDNQNMTIDVAVIGPPVDVVLAALLTGGYLALKPVTVRINYYFPSAPDGPIFGFDGASEYIAGFDVGSWGAPSPFTP